MGNKTLIPAFKAQVGDWNYYICHMSYGQVAREVNFAHELAGNTELNQLIQRGLSDRTKDITEYLINSQHRFLGALIVAAWGGEPLYTPVEITDSDSLTEGLDKGFGVLTFDGNQQYFALDGQHRLKAIKEAVLKNQDLLTEDICVIMVSHFDTEEGRQRTRRLFTNINRNAKVTSGAENIVLDEDDGIAILTRRLIQEHDFLKEEGRVRVILGQDSEGKLKIAGKSIPKSDKSAITSILTLYNILRNLAFDQPKEIRNEKARPNNDLLDASYEVLSSRIDDLLESSGSIKDKLLKCDSARDVRAPKDNEGIGHPFMRPIVQEALTKAISQCIQQELIDWSGAMTKIAKLDWKLSSAPWTAIWSAEGNKILSGTDFSKVLVDLLICNIAPPSKQFVKDARRNYKNLRERDFPQSAEILYENIPITSEGPTSDVAATDGN
ncbi:MAG: DNA sulfur modification protein DndB [Acidobacteria bacterium]|nr:DNA sulfur modification protein DndB [Acidobacteriota bacterium]|tara:strand:- start:628 stop:1944 length:1317 start_codon:yes stop_codon:yes gene_type:complete